MKNKNIIKVIFYYKKKWNKIMNEKTRTVSTRLSTNTYLKLKKISEKQDRSISSLIKIILDDVLEGEF